jgi:hypothetical protein
VASQPGGNGLPGLIVGWLYGLVVGGVVRLFRVPAPVFPLAGLLAGPLPVAVLMPDTATAEARGLIGAAALAGLVIGLIEWAVSRRMRASSAGEP